MEYVLNAAYSSATLLLVAVGLAVIFGLMRVINLAHGEFVMLGAYGSIVATDALGSFWYSLVLVPAALAFVGLIVEWLIVRRLYHRPLETIVATFGLAIVLRELVRAVAGPDFRTVENPLEQSITLLGTEYPMYRCVLILIVAAVTIGLLFVQRKTRLGLVARAVIDRPSLASSLGINTKLVYALTFGLGIGLAGLAGVLLAPTVNIHPEMGGPFVIGAFLAVLVGGMGSLRGLVIAVILLAGVQYGLAQAFTPVVGSIALVVVSVAILKVLPDGFQRARAS